MAAELPVTYDNASLWSNLTSWTAQQIRDAVSASRYAESLLNKLGYFIPVDNFGQRVIPEATPLNMLEETTTTTSEALAETIRSVASSAASSVASQVLSPESTHDLPHKVGADNGKGLGSFFSYMTSKWAISCILMAIILNRTHIFAASRRRLRLRFHVRLALRFIPAILLLLFARRVLRSIQCQTSPHFSDLRWGNASVKSDLMFANPNVFFNRLTSTLLLGATDQESCEAVRMIPAEPGSTGMHGSLSILWPLFGVFCLSQFLEIVSCAVQGRSAATETCMTLFEISLAFAEADSALGNQLGWSILSSPTSSSDQASGQAIAITRSMILSRVNTPVEVLIVALICIASHFTSHILGVALLQSKLRLAQTSFWAILFISCIMTSFYNFNLEDPASQGLLRFPTVCLIGHIPHIIVLVGIVICGTVYGIAIVLAAASPAPGDGADGAIPIASQESGFWSRMKEAHGNMQANLSLGDARISASTDFYTALLRAGMSVISMASEAVYLQEDRGINLQQHTWLEDERYKELNAFREDLAFSRLPGVHGDMSGTMGMVPVNEEQERLANGYARERSRQSVAKIYMGDRKPRTGVGAAERSTRWVVAFDYLYKTMSLAARVQSKIILSMMRWLGIRWRPRWLLSMAEAPRTSAEKDDEAKKRASKRERGKRPEWEVSNNGKMYVPRRGDVDVEDWVRKNMRLRNNGQYTPSEQEVDNQLYKWWLDGGFWGHEDKSGEYEPVEDDDDDTTSVFSMATTTDAGGGDDGWESMDEDDQLADGQRTPTQTTFDRTLSRGEGLGDSTGRHREGTPMMDTPMPMSDLARLLNPSSLEEREEARALAAHLQSEKILTRSQYNKVLLRQKSRVLFPRGLGSGFGTGRAKKWTPEEEAVVLEQILLSRRAAAAVKRGGNVGGGVGSSSTEDVLLGEALTRSATGHTAGSSSALPPMSPSMNGGDWASGAAGMGENGPQCVVCHSESRTIIVWPCRCLSLCDECRVNLAMNNYGNCVCCRREVVSFSRIYVP
ncbi:Protein ASI1 [Zalerion maritima]|uniref:Protein ASI1 n=1 Tax=Zalerion maritima TaxID=339359 RepID=A0AAD5RWJ2_9PEZI|nr:Protein ASI1 [Zalerion maritima]